MYTVVKKSPKMKLRKTIPLTVTSKKNKMTKIKLTKET